MSSIRRFLVGSAASWAKIGVTVASQIVLVPVFLSHWTLEEYGCWLIVQTIVGLGSLLSVGHQTYIGFEFLRFGHRDVGAVRTLFYSALPFAILIGVIELLTLLALIRLGMIGPIFNLDHTVNDNLMHQMIWSLVIYSVSWLITGSVGGLAGRAVAPYGEYPRMAWWAVALAVGVSVTSGAAVSLGSDLVHTSAWIAMATLIVNIPIHLALWRIFRLNRLYIEKPNWALGFQNTAHSILVSLSTVLDMLRQQGVRLFLGAIVGVDAMTTFSTMRTLSNLSLQGIGTVTNPIMPEIMRFLRDRDSARTNAAAGFIWLLAVILLAPTLIVFQGLMPVLFRTWTRGKIHFEPEVFATFSVALLFYAAARPSAAVLQGNNLLKIQLWISVLVSAIALVGIFALSPKCGLLGAGFALLAAELAGTALASWFAWRWLVKEQIDIPWNLFWITTVCIATAASSIALIAVKPAMSTAIIVTSLIAHLFLLILFVRNLPALALDRFRLRKIRSK